VLVLEAAGRAGGRDYAHLAGIAWGTDAYDLARVRSRRSAIGPLMKDALAQAGRAPGDIDYVNAHGTGTVANDPMEAAAIREALGDAADDVPVSSVKAAIGHLLGAAGGVELVLAVLAMRDGVLPPTLNLNDPDPACALNHVANVAAEREINTAVKISAGFGGHIGIVVLERGERSR